MARLSKTGGKSRVAKSHRTSSKKGRDPAKAVLTQPKRSTVSGLGKELDEAREQQAATAEILKVIASSPSDVQPVFDAILARALHLCKAAFGFLTSYDGERYEFAAQLGVPPALAEHFRIGMDQPRPGDAHWRLLDGEDMIDNLDQKDEDAYQCDRNICACQSVSLFA